MTEGRGKHVFVIFFQGQGIQPGYFTSLLLRTRIPGHRKDLSRSVNYSTRCRPPRFARPLAWLHRYMLTTGWVKYPG